MWEAIETPRPSAWRVIFKGLTLLEHLLKNGSERCVDDARNHSHLLRNMDRFNYYEGTVDRGVGVREKSKQIVEMLGDDERIREERQKARQLREKFAGRGAVASNSGRGGGGTGANGGVKYEGYGNSDANWARSDGGGGGGSRGYGDGGIGSSSGARGRYGEEDTAPSRSSRSPAVATKKSSKSSVSGGTKVKKVKKKKPIEPAPAAPEVDLFSFDTPASAPAPSAGVDTSFDAFQTAPAPTPALASPPASVPVANDDFGDFQQIAPTSAVEFDAFGSAPAAPAQQSFDAFGGAPAQMQPVNAMNNAFGNMTMQSQPQQMPTMTTPAPIAGNDDFGDFEDADPVSVKSPEKSSDPLSKLISLDGLSKNPKKEEKKESKPIDFSQPLGGSSGMSSMGGEQGGFQPQPVLGTGQQGDIGEVFGSMLNQQQQQQQQQQQMMKQQQMMQQQQGMANMGMGMNGQQLNQMGGMGGMMGGQQPQQGMMNNGGMMSGNMGMGGQMQGNMGMMGGQQMQPQMNNNMMGGQMNMMGNGNMNMMGNNMQGQMPMMGNMMGNMMGGQSGQGFR